MIKHPKSRAILLILVASVLSGCVNLASVRTIYEAKNEPAPGRIGIGIATLKDGVLLWRNGELPNQPYVIIGSLRQESYHRDKDRPDEDAFREMAKEHGGNGVIVFGENISSPPPGEPGNQ